MATNHRKLDRSITVVGAGVLGLSTALLLQEEYATVIIVAAESPTASPMANNSESGAASVDYASMWAGAHYRPIPCLPESEFTKVGLSHEQQKFHLQLAYEQGLAITTAKRMKRIARQYTQSGVRIVRGEEYLESAPPENLSLRTGDVYASDDDEFKVLNQAELDTLNTSASARHNGNINWGCTYETYILNVHLYCRWLLDRFCSNGGRIIRRRLSSISDAFDVIGQDQKHLNLIVNCSGRNLDSDPAVKPIRGQTVLVRNKYDKTVTRQCADGTWSFLIPRPLNGGTIIGGTKEIGDAETNPRPETRQRLLENAVRYFPDFVAKVEDFDVVTDNVGRRPWRSGGLRIELENLNGGKGIVHGYGAGGRGYELSWGVAEEICALVKNHSPNKSVSVNL